MGPDLRWRICKLYFSNYLTSLIDLHWEPRLKVHLRFLVIHFIPFNQGHHIVCLARHASTHSLVEIQQFYMFAWFSKTQTLWLPSCPYRTDYIFLLRVCLVSILKHRPLVLAVQWHKILQMLVWCSHTPKQLLCNTQIWYTFVWCSHTPKQLLCNTQIW